MVIVVNWIDMNLLTDFISFNMSIAASLYVLWNLEGKQLLLLSQVKHIQVIVRCWKETDDIKEEQSTPYLKVLGALRRIVALHSSLGIL
jgi:hypothetical protein